MNFCISKINVLALLLSVGMTMGIVVTVHAVEKDMKSGHGAAGHADGHEQAHSANAAEQSVQNAKGAIQSDGSGLWSDSKS